MMRDFPAPVISDIQRSMAKARFSCPQSAASFAASRDDGRLSAHKKAWQPMRFLLRLKTARGRYGLASAAVGWSVGPARVSGSGGPRREGLRISWVWEPRESAA